MDKTKKKPNISFKEITKSFEVKKIKNLNPKKTSQSNDIPTKVVKEYSIFTTVILNIMLNILTNAWIMVPFQKF